MIQFIPVVLHPQFLRSGVLFPRDNLPGMLPPLASIMPVSEAVDGPRQVFVRATSAVKSTTLTVGVGTRRLNPSKRLQTCVIRASS